MIKILRIWAMILLALLGLSATYGSYGLLSDLSGAKLGWTVDLLKNTPFNDFLIPGIILFVANGLLAFIVFIMTLQKSKGHGLGIVIQGLVLLVWLIVEIIFGIYDVFLTAGFVLLAVMLIYLGLNITRRETTT